MASAAAKMGHNSGVQGVQRKHYCPECPADAKGQLQPMRATMIMPKRRIEFRCHQGHAATKGNTILK